MIGGYSELVHELEELYTAGKLDSHAGLAGAELQETDGFLQVAGGSLPENIMEFILAQYCSELKRDFKSLLDNDDDIGLNLQRYDIGECIIPHEDHVRFLYLQLLTTSENEHDGLVLYDTGEKRHIFYPDVAGNIIQIHSGCTHWVNPVRDGVRWTAALQHFQGIGDPVFTYHPELTV